jgi:hypothetical protein
MYSVATWPVKGIVEIIGRRKQSKEVTNTFYPFP